MAVIINIGTLISNQAYNSMRGLVEYYDGSFTSISHNGGFCQINVSGMSYVSDPGLIYIKGTGNAAIDGYQVVKSSTALSVTIDLAYNLAYASLSGYVIDITNKKNRFIDVRVYTSENGDDDTTLVGTKRISLFPTINNYFDPSKMLQSYFVFKNDNSYSYASHGRLESNLCGLCSIDIYEGFEDSTSWSPTPEGWDTISFLSEFIAASLKLNDSFIHEDSFITYMDTVDKTGKFLTLFGEPIANIGLPFDISAYVKNDGEADDIKFNITAYSASGSQLATDSFTIKSYVNYSGGAQKYLIRATTMDEFGHSGQAYSLINIAAYDSSSPPAETIMGETKKIVVNQPCEDTLGRSVYLCWLNRLGGFDYYLFEARYEQIVDVDDGDTVVKELINLSSDETVNNVIHKESVETYRLFARVRSINKNGIVGLLESPFVQMLANIEDFYENYDNEISFVEARWITVVVKKGSYSIGMSDSGVYEVELEIQLPKYRSQTIC